MATHSSGLAWRIPGTGEPGGLPSMGSHRVRHNWSNLAAAAAAAENSKDLQILCLYVPWLLFGKKQWASMSVEATTQAFVASSYLHLWFESPAMKTIRLFTFLFFFFFFFFNCDSPPMIDENEGSRVKLPNPEAWSPFICDLGLIIHCF